MVATTAPLDEPMAHPRPGRTGSDHYWRRKARIDAVIGSALLILTAPFVLLAMALVRLTSRGPAIYRQRRLGRAGKVFTIYKIRSMYLDCERQSGAVWSRPGDPRVTPVGRILRATHIDELPQLINIVRGEMALVGPRPERPEIMSQLEAVIPHIRTRLEVKPGLTGLAQVQLPPDAKIAGVRAKLDLDLRYIEHASHGLDLVILLATALKVEGVPFATIRGLLGSLTRLPDVATLTPALTASQPHEDDLSPPYRPPLTSLISVPSAG